MKIFISYSSKNRALVETLASDLESFGHEVWFDKELSGGQAWWDQILTAIRGCDLCVFALTSQSLESVACQREYAYAGALNKRILPVMLGTVDTSILPTALAHLQIVDYRQMDHASGIKLGRALNALPPAGSLPEPLPQPPAEPLSPLARIRDKVEALSLNFQEQAALILELKELLDHAETADGAQQLVMQLRSRSDLFERPADELDELVRDLPTMHHRPGPAPTRPAIPVRGLLAAGAAIVLLTIAVLVISQLGGSGKDATGATAQAQTAVAGGPDATQTTLAQNFAALDLTNTKIASNFDTSMPKAIQSIAPKATATSSPTQTPLPPTATAANTASALVVTPIGPLRLHTGSIYSVAYSPDGRLIATGSGDNNARLWDSQTGISSILLKSHRGGVRSVAFSPDSNYVLTGSGDYTAKLWDTAQGGASIRTYSGHTGVIYSVAFSPDGKNILTGSADYTARLWDTQTGTLVRTFTVNQAAIYSVAFSPDGKNVLIGSADNTAQSWDTATGKSLMIFSGHASSVYSAAYSPDGKNVLTGSYDNTARLWDAQTGKVLRTFKGHSHEVWSVAFSPDGKYIVTGSGDNTARLWDVKHDGPSLYTFTGHTGPVYSVAFSPDGKYIVTGSYDNTVRVWDLQSVLPVHTFNGSPGVS